MAFGMFANGLAMLLAMLYLPTIIGCAIAGYWYRRYVLSVVALLCGLGLNVLWLYRVALWPPTTAAFIAWLICAAVPALFCYRLRRVNAVSAKSRSV